MVRRISRLPVLAFVLVVPLAYYLLAVRRAGWPARTLIPIVLLSLTGAAHIVAVHKKAPKSEPFVRTALPTARPMWIELSEPVTAQGPYGIEKKVRWISVAVDEAEELRKALGHPLQA